MNLLSRLAGVWCNAMWFQKDRMYLLSRLRGAGMDVRSRPTGEE